MKILITGGAGFIGSHLSEHYLKCGDDVTVLDNLSTGSIENIQHLKEDPHFHYHIDSMMNVPFMAELIDGCDVVFHMAAAVGVRLIVEDPVSTIETNIKGTEIILELANKKKRRVLLASTSEVYGKNPKAPFNEEDDMVFGPSYKSRWSYACSKAIDEFLALAYWRDKRLPLSIVRLFNTVGPRQTGRYGMVIPNFVHQAIHEKPITVHSDGQQSRSFLHVEDAINGLTRIMESEECLGEIINIGHGKEITILELAERVKKLTNSHSEIKFIPYDEAFESGFEDMRRRVPDISKAKKLIGFSPKHDIDRILNDVIDSYRSV